MASSGMILTVRVRPRSPNGPSRHTSPQAQELSLQVEPLPGAPFYAALTYELISLRTVAPDTRLSDDTSGFSYIT